MARAGIYKSEVVRARNNLLAMGRYPSIDAIRGELGNTGSKGTIHRFLKEIEEEEGGSTGRQVAVSEAIQDLSARLAERLHEEAEQRLSSLTDKHKVEVAELNSAITVLKGELESFRAQAERLTLELAAEQQAHAETQAKLQQRQIVLAQAVQRGQHLEEQLRKEEAYRQSVEEKHQHAREALDHFRMAAKEQREQEHRQSEQQLQFLQGELRSAKDELNVKQQELVRSHEDNARLSSEMTHARGEIRRLDTEVRSLRNVKEQLGLAELKCAQAAERLAAVHGRVETLSAECEASAAKLQEALAARQAIEAELAAAKAVLASQEQILLKLPTLVGVPAKATEAKKKDGTNNKNSLFESDS